MQIKSKCHHRFVTSGSARFVTEDGVRVTIDGGEFQTCHACGHVDFPLETKELIEANIKEKRVYYDNAAEINIKLIDLL